MKKDKLLHSFVKQAFQYTIKTHGKKVLKKTSLFLRTQRQLELVALRDDKYESAYKQKGIQPKKGPEDPISGDI